MPSRLVELYRVGSLESSRCFCRSTGQSKGTSNCCYLLMKSCMQEQRRIAAEREEIAAVLIAKDALVTKKQAERASIEGEGKIDILRVLLKA